MGSHTQHHRVVLGELPVGLGSIGAQPSSGPPGMDSLGEAALFGADAQRGMTLSGVTGLLGEVCLQGERLLSPLWGPRPRNKTCCTTWLPSSSTTGGSLGTGSPSWWGSVFPPTGTAGSSLGTGPPSWLDRVFPPAGQSLGTVLAVEVRLHCLVTSEDSDHLEVVALALPVVGLLAGN